MRGHRVTGVDEGSIADQIGVEIGDNLLSVDGKPIADVFDFRMLTASDCFTIEIEKQDGELWEIEIETRDEELGVSFEDGLMDEAKSCRNQCIFCFIDQNPRGMRETIYFKDDDARLSFLRGNYITLTNMRDSEIDRVIRYRFSPINVSVHATNPDVRRKMLNNRHAGDVLERLAKLCRAGIDINLQIVLCKGINDGAELDRSIAELEALGSHSKSLSVVPAGLTKYRQKLYPLKPFSREESANVLEQIETWQYKFQKKRKSAFVFAADEFYLQAGRKVPPYKDYEGFPQLENGVGMLALEGHKLDLAMRRAKPRAARKSATIITGRAAYEFAQNAAKQISEVISGANIGVCPVDNDFFGAGVTVSGLLAGHDIIEALSRFPLGDVVILPKNLLREQTDMLIDDMTVGYIADEIGREIIVAGNMARVAEII